MKRAFIYILIPAILILASCTNFTYDPTNVGFRELVKAGAATTGMLSTLTYLTSQSGISVETVNSIMATAAAGRAVVEEDSTQEEVLDSLNDLIEHIDNAQAKQLCKQFLPQLVLLTRAKALDKIEEQFGEVGAAWTTLVNEATVETLRGIELGAALYLAYLRTVPEQT